MTQWPQIDQMLRTIQDECRFTAGHTGIKKISDRVMDAMARVVREDFVPDDMKPFAYDNRPLPIGDGQTISQPFIVALMTELLDPQPDDVILEVGAGSGYQAAILSVLVQKVYSIEIVESLAAKARTNLKKMGYDNIEVVSADGYKGLPDKGPFDGIIMTAAAPYIPQPLKEQIRPGGRMVVPVGRPYSSQILQLVEKKNDGRVEENNVLAVAFVPLTGDYNG